MSRACGRVTERGGLLAEQEDLRGKQSGGQTASSISVLDRTSRVRDPGAIFSIVIALHVTRVSIATATRLWRG